MPSFEPGWDCHGLPIEQKALASAKVRSTNASSSRLTLSADLARQSRTNENSEHCAKDGVESDRSAEEGVARSGRHGGLGQSEGYL